MAETPEMLTGNEVREGVASFICADLPEDVSVSMRPVIFNGLGKSCSFNGSFSKVMASWWITYWRDGEKVRSNWWVDYTLDDYGMITVGGMGYKGYEPAADAVTKKGEIPYMPPDKFRRQTAQPIPVTPRTESAKEDNRLGISQAHRGRPRKQRDV